MDSLSNVSLICTIPRSGTNLLSYFFKYLALFLTKNDLIANEPEQEVFSQLISGFSHKLGRQPPMIGHGYCPGFETYNSNPWHKQWSSIPSTNDWFNVVSQYGVASNTSYDPNLNTKVRLAFTYRNPLDCMLSLYDHLQEHREFDQSLLSLEFLTASILPQYIKSYVSFREMKQIFPENIFFLSYELLMSDRKKYLLQVASFFSFNEEPNFQAAFLKAFEFTEVAKMKMLEQFMNKTLADDQKSYDTSKSHIRAIDRSLERGNIPSEILDQIKLMLQEYNITEFDESFRLT